MYVMSAQENSQQIGQLMLDKKASETALAQLKLKATNIGATFLEIGSALKNNPENLAFPHQSVDTRFRVNWIQSANVATYEEIKVLVDAIRAEQVKLWGFKESLKNLGF